MKTALLVIDIQKDYFPGGKFPLVNPEEAAKNAYMLLQCFREHGGRHIHIQHIALKPDAPFFVRGTEGSDIHDSAAHFEGEPIVYKHYPNSFRETNLLEMLKEWGIERVVITGMMTHMCVDATARAAADFGFKVIVAEDACATRAFGTRRHNHPRGACPQGVFGGVEVVWSGDEIGGSDCAVGRRGGKDCLNRIN
jgi:nicotinamidase-related amidase